MSDQVKNVAWEVEISDMRCIVFTTTKPKAKFVAFKAYKEAGYGVHGSWPAMSCGRRPDLDNSPFAKEKPRAYAEEYVT